MSQVIVRRVLQAGQIFAGRYRVESRIAQGGMGAVFAAEHLATEERVALKLLWPHVLGSKAAVESFQLEARVTARIGSEHIVRILDAGFDAGLGVPYLVMELLRGVTLRALVGETGPLTPAEALFALRQVAKALDKAHSHLDREGRQAPIVHRDLKPENIFVSTRSGSDVAVKVLDFGIAKVLSESQQVSHDVKGTPLFMAREQFSHGAVTPQLDVWALGLIAFYLLAGRVYWLASARGAEGVAPLLYEVVMQPLVSPSERASSLGLSLALPAGFDEWFLRCLAPDPTARFASAGAAVGALAEVFAHDAGLSEVAAAALADRVARSLESLREAAAAAKEAQPTTQAAHDPPGASELIHNAPTDYGTTPPSSITASSPSNEPSKVQARGMFTKASAITLGATLGALATLGLIFTKRGAPHDEVNVVPSSPAPPHSHLETPPAASLPSPIAPTAAAPPRAFPVGTQPGPASSAKTTQPSTPTRRPPRAADKVPKEAGAATPRAQADGGEEARTYGEPQPPPKPASSRNIYSEP